MKKVQKQRVYCSRCGDEISEEELATLSGPTCAWCEHMYAEAVQVWAEKNEVEAHNAALVSHGPMIVNSR